jgi:hypothetical protein
VHELSLRGSLGGPTVIIKEGRDAMVWESLRLPEWPPFPTPWGEHHDTAKVQLCASQRELYFMASLHPKILR